MTIDGKFIQITGQNIMNTKIHPGNSLKKSLNKRKPDSSG